MVCSGAHRLAVPATPFQPADVWTACLYRAGLRKPGRPGGPVPSQSTPRSGTPNSTGKTPACQAKSPRSSPCIGCGASTSPVLADHLDGLCQLLERRYAIAACRLEAIVASQGRHPAPAPPLRTPSTEPGASRAYRLFPFPEQGVRISMLIDLPFVEDGHPFGTLRKYARRYGDPFTLKLLPGPIVVTGTPEGIRELLTALPQTFESNGAPFLAPLVGEHSVLL